MDTSLGLRERKKLRTRRTLIETGLRLFAENGYDATTVADICAAAELSPATFFAYFPAKEDLVFADQPERVAAMREIIAARRPGEPLREVLMRGMDRLAVSEQWSIPPDDELVAIRARLIATEPALRAVALRRLFDVQREWADALAEAFPDELDELGAHAVIGSVVGAVIGVALANLRRGDAALPMPEAVTRAAEAAMAGLPPAVR
ncbi:TetR family transcriptional regulator [Nonomuraea aridisoli]|uniref:TetR/AcrR family transcriptional regulator n=1 Tax=Nonomuraea aridisoli TaxID=2070368 RepID=A0A2W2EYV3_9ACTN|nr:TetR family transcriptional regulator [Nonomuraea aridisoli]PZG22079.1 TetR/AcrR family transcriptional regulator [Nonomuraea aridisoli]